MKFRIVPISSMALLIFLAGFCAASAAEIDWYSAEEGLIVARAEQRKVFLNFYAEWCAYCTKMDETTFTDPEVIDYLSRHYVSVRVNSDKEKRLAAEYFVRGLPSSWFLDEEGNKISNLPGYIDAAMLLNILRYIASDSYKTISFKEFLDRT